MKLSTKSYVIDVETGCWRWLGAPNGSGYGQIRSGGKFRQAHRVVWEENRGPVPEGLDLDHLCRNRICVNPEHLEPVTRRENTLRGVGISAENARKTHCRNGHAFDTENTYIHPKRGSRLCRTCNRESVAAYKLRRAAA